MQEQQGQINKEKWNEQPSGDGILAEHRAQDTAVASVVAAYSVPYLTENKNSLSCNCKPGQQSSVFP